jgi:hypothetical protein
MRQEDEMSYQRPSVTRFGNFRDLTQAGCTGMSDGRTFEGAPGDVSTGATPRVTNGTTDFCFTGRGSR